MGKGTDIELVWDGKYDQSGRKTGPVRISLPFQTVETVNETAQERQKTLDLFTAGRNAGWRNRLIWGDKKYVLPALLDEFAGKVDLVYIDPPFATGADFSLQIEVADENFTKLPSVIEQKAYRDTWGRGLTSYLAWFHDTVVLLRDFLAPTGTLYVHLDWRMVHYARVVLDEVFHSDRFENEIVWQRSLPHGNVDYKFGASHDTLLRYTKTEQYKWHPQYLPHREEYLRDFYKYTEADGRRYRLISCINPNPDRPNLRYAWKGVTRVWKFSKERMARMDEEGLLVYSKNGVPSYKGYLDQMKGTPMQDVWTDIAPLMGSSREWVEYPTQKPEALVERLLASSTDENDLVLDCFVGSGTTAAAAEKMSRRWIAADLSRFAVHTTRKRLLGIKGVRPFVVQNLGKYERQAWQRAEFSDDAAAREFRYRNFILTLYGATPLSGHVWLHGTRNGRMVHVGAVDAPVSPGDITQMIVEFKRAVGRGSRSPTSNGTDILGWDFAFELNEVARQQAALANIDLRFFRIPRDVMDKRAVEQGDIKFFELAALSVAVTKKARAVTVALKDFVIPLDDIPHEIQKTVKDWTEWIDYWAVDWDFKNDAFHNEWQTYRTRKLPKLEKSVQHTYEEPGRYVVVVKVIDILGNDTTKSVTLDIK